MTIDYNPGSLAREAQDADKAERELDEQYERMTEQQVRDRFGGDLPGGWDENPWSAESEAKSLDEWIDTADEGGEEYGSPSGQPYLDKHDIDGPSL